MIVGLMPGTSDLRQFELAGDGALGYAYVFGLSTVQLGAGFLTVGLVQALLAGQRPDDGRVAGVPLTVMIACYAPILLWGPLELLATYGYWLCRHRSPAALPKDN